ncbi:hypothetical protein [Xanthomonas arboricola]|uniref:CelD/BcsL family acetyltransferase involved in cellulose biosynthesis n=1 Tax=Xanthomonas arboricola TaxID=56448 RepID=A0AB73H692_9XANT|nr:hypothetical protein [Xanthomonas arboricola]MBB5672978.1 CelD/BcsL family acetyltransferase involved in cellulose biosynthesis [Xanthomonas arboricola]
MKINNKAMRKIDHSLGRMYKGIGPIKFSKEAENSRDALARMIQLSRHRILEFTEAGFSEFKDIVKNIHSMQILVTCPH